ncbi:protein SUPPRESSOR OF K(+) TRANSPORT GROWTH DEFECT 1-like isoform X3 [Quercus lobata]|uniref:protein SUPPRESSOR OF K(+) TRANSPORT GROWTH DEFECT 1-like isoform X3 n=1 Tax=Quercus lobata TaxID=97700 RepID=UPI0012445A04|nr:protein SUPPRESSOR OF K(+) TRANSPORT GROWTH DEFECT 1-like isoform X3 [Quercus lobata]
MQWHIGETPHNLGTEDFQYLASKTDGFSGSGISICVKMHYISLFVQLLMLNSSENILQACGSIAKVITQKLRSVPSRNLKQKSKLQRSSYHPTQADFDSVLEKQKPTVSKAEIDACEKFTKDFGIDG